MRTLPARRFIAAAILFSAIAVTATAQRIFADVTGKWTVTVTGPDGANESMATLKQEGESITGTIESAMFGSSKVAGTVKADTVRYGFTIDVQGMAIELRASALLKDKDNMIGTLDAQNGIGSFPFTAKRQP